MKRTLKLFLLVAIIATSATLASAQKAGKPFSGTIKFALSYDGVEASQLAQMPTSQTLYISGNKQKTVLDLGQYAMFTITDGDAESFIFFVDAMGQKFAYRMDKAAIAKEKADDKSPKPTVTLSDETKEIAGVKCKKATMVAKDEETGDESSTIVWYTNELGSNDKLNFMGENEGITGIVLGSETKVKAITRKSYATEIKKGKVKDLEFLIPEEAKEMTKEEFMKMFGGGGEEE
jgi:GLPGLI family protein